MVGSLYSVRIVVRIIVGDIFHNSRVEDRISIVLKGHRELGMLKIVFLIC